MDKWIQKVVPGYMAEASIDIDTFIKLYNNGECEIVDIRMDFEYDVWSLNFGLNIPLNELGHRIDELPTDKLIVLSCPTGPRSIVAWTFLDSKGLNVKFLKGGLSELTAALKGSRAKEFHSN
jgi:rhodanese-related sulfurtransferase